MWGYAPTAPEGVRLLWVRSAGGAISVVRNMREADYAGFMLDYDLDRPLFVQPTHQFSRQGLVRDRDRLRDADEGPWHQEVHHFGLNYRLPDVLAAVADGVDVLNYSIGGTTESSVLDPVAQALRGASNANAPVRNDDSKGDGGSVSQSNDSAAGSSALNANKTEQEAKQQGSGGTQAAIETIAEAMAVASGVTPQPVVTGSEDVPHFKPG